MTNHEPSKRTILLPYGMSLTLASDRRSGTIRGVDKAGLQESQVSAFDAVESLVLGHAMAGVNVEDPAYLHGLTTALDAIANNQF